MARLARDYRVAAGGHCWTVAEETDRGTVHKEPLGDCDDDDRRRHSADDRRACRQEGSRHGPPPYRRRACGWLGAGPRADTGFEPVRIDDYGWLVCGPDARDGGAVLVSAFDSGDCCEWPVGVE